MYDVAIIGGGPAGLMAAYRAHLRGLSVVIYDPNRQLGRKLRITGKGRCNVCNNCDIKTIMENIPGDGRFLYSALNRFSPSDVMAFFESRGVPLKTERGMRVFPVSDNANDIAEALIIKDIPVIHEFKRQLSGAKAFIIATGGCSYPLTGSNGNGYELAKSIGHTIIEPKASLVPLVSPDEFCRTLQGVAPKNIVLKLYKDNKLIYKELGEMLFTHFGISGPLVLTASSHMREDAQYKIELDLKPGLDDAKLDLRMLRDINENANKSISNVLPKLVGSSMTPVIMDIAGIDNKICNALTKEERTRIRTVIKSFPISISGKRPIDEAIVTSGGVNLKEINPRTMQSKLDDRVYFAGEVLNLDAYTGGFNLQIAWSTGFVAGEEVLCSV